MPSATEIRIRHAQLDEGLRREALNAMMVHPATRKLLWWMLEQGNAFGNPNPFSTDPLQMAHNTGIMQVGQSLLRELIATDPEHVVALMREMEDERRERERELFGADAGPDPAAGDGWYDNS
jgi:hypothetical protein